jgi:hypothetical protein
MHDSQSNGMRAHVPASRPTRIFTCDGQTPAKLFVILTKALFSEWPGRRLSKY